VTDTSRKGPPEGVAQKIEARLRDRDGKRKGDEIIALCPWHEDKKPSFWFNVEKWAGTCRSCNEKTGWKKLAGALGIELPNRAALRRQSRNAERERRELVKTYPYVNATGELIAEKCRYSLANGGKDFGWRRPDGAGGHVHSLGGVDVGIYNLPAVLAAVGSGDLVFVVEGEKDADNLIASGLVGTTTPGGAGKWHDAHAEHFRGTHTVIVGDNDDPGRRHVALVASKLRRVAASVRVLELRGVPLKGDVSDWLQLGHTTAELVEIAKQTPPWRDVALDSVVAAFRRWLHLPDASALYLVLATILANLMPGDPVWLMLVAAPGQGKTEILGSLGRLPYLFAVATLTESALLSGTSLKDKATDAHGGLLRQMGDFGIICAKDFTSVLAMHRDARAAVLAALREIYDGSWVRRLGTDGGRELAWKGKVGMIAACTPAIDSAHSVTGSMGERFVMFRLPDTDDDAQAMAALASIGAEDEMRGELSTVVKDFLDGITVPDKLPAIGMDDRRRLSALASLAVRCRSAVERDPVRREIIQVPQAEAPARLARVLARLLVSLRLLGVANVTAWAIITKAALDSMPQVRGTVFDLLRGEDGWLETGAIGVRTGYPAETARRAVQDLTAHGVVERRSNGKGNADDWRLSGWAREKLSAATVSDLSDAAHTPTDEPSPSYSLSLEPLNVRDDFSETVPRSASVADQVEYPDWSDDEEVPA
jgi:hypothetical protein